jgi:hypothetical protein
MIDGTALALATALRLPTGALDDPKRSDRGSCAGDATPPMRPTGER